MNTPILQKLIICRTLLQDSSVQKLTDVLADPKNESGQYELIAALIERSEKLGLSGNLIQSYITYLMSQQGNLAALMIERSEGKIGTSLYRAFHSDMMILQQLLTLVPSSFLPNDLLDNYQPTKVIAYTSFATLQDKLATATNAKACADIFLDYYRTYGYGDIANYRAFRWDEKKQLVGIRHFDKMELDDLIGYARQKKTLVDNTEAFVDGKPANNVLLVGARGTGKSSGVKALANKFFDHGLRLLQITKHQLVQLPKIMETLRLSSSKKFIIFLDDLSFEDFEVEYKYLKSAIEGGVESKPANVLIYATSNRRHLIKESWKNRGEVNDEIHRNDGLNETISLSDRFGLTISYLAPNQEEYLEIIDALLRREGIELDAEELRIQAIRWETSHSGRSGRTAQQFVNHYLSKSE